MSNNFKKFVREAQKTSLSETEKSDIRARLMSHMDETPVTGAMSWQEIPRRVSIFSFIKGYAGSSALMPAFLLLLLVGGGSLSLASQSSLPGDAMYSAKILSERVDLLFAFSPAAEVRVNALQAIRRLEEAEALSADGRLDSVTRLSLETSFSDSSSRALTRLDQIGSDDKNTKQKILSEFRGNLFAHKDILQSIAVSDEATSTSILPGEVQRVIAVLSNPSSSSMSIGVETDDSAGDAKAVAKQKISDAQKYISVGMTGDAKTKSSNALIGAQASYENGLQAEDASAYKDAVVLFKQATEQASQAKAIAESYKSAGRYIAKLPKRVQSVAPVRAATSTTPAIVTATIAATTTVTASSTTASTTATTTRSIPTTSTSTASTTLKL